MHFIFESLNLIDFIKFFRDIAIPITNTKYSIIIIIILIIIIIIAIYYLLFLLLIHSTLLIKYYSGNSLLFLLLITKYDVNIYYFTYYRNVSVFLLRKLKDD